MIGIFVCLDRNTPSDRQQIGQNTYSRFELFIDACQVERRFVFFGWPSKLKARGGLQFAKRVSRLGRGTAALRRILMDSLRAVFLLPRLHRVDHRSFDLVDLVLSDANVVIVAGRL